MSPVDSPTEQPSLVETELDESNRMIWKEPTVLTRKITYFCMVVALASQTLSSQAAWGQEIHWAPDVPTARRASMEYKVPVLIHFYGDNCLPCKVLEQNVLSRHEVVETLNKYFICVRVNASQDRETAAQYGVHSWPTDVFISPDGKTLDQGVCKQTESEYLGVLHTIAVMNRDRNAMLAAEQSNNAQQVTSQVANHAPAQPVGTAASGVADGAANRTNPPALAALPGGLPPAGQVHPGNPQGPNFYAQGAEPQRQQLPQSLSPNAGVSSGPTLSQDQPHAVTTAVQAAGNQIASASQPHALNTTLGHLPPMDTTGQVGAAPPGRGTDPLAALMSTAPSVPATVAVAAAPAANAWNQPRGALATASQSHMVDNPHFNSSPATAAKIPTNTVSFQPRAALSPEANSGGSTSNRPANNTPEHAMASPQQPATQQPATAGAASESATLALDGYCPVTLQSHGNWVIGQPQFAVRHRGRIYHLSSQEAMQEFLQNPDRCSPVMSGYDAMTFLNEGKLVEGSIQFGLHDLTSGNILLFTSAESKQAYEQNFDRNTQALKIVLQKAGIVQ